MSSFAIIMRGIMVVLPAKHIAIRLPAEILYASRHDLKDARHPLEIYLLFVRLSLLIWRLDRPYVFAVFMDI